MRIPTARDFRVIIARTWRMHAQNVRDFPQTKLDSEMNSPFLLNELGDPPPFFFQVSAMNVKVLLRLKKTILFFFGFQNYVN